MRFKNYWKTLLIAAFILFGSIMSSKELNKIPLFEIKNSDKLIHFAMYFVFTYLANLVDAYVDAHLFDFSVTEDFFRHQPMLNIRMHF